MDAHPDPRDERLALARLCLDQAEVARASHDTTRDPVQVLTVVGRAGRSAKDQADSEIGRTFYDTVLERPASDGSGRRP